MNSKIIVALEAMTVNLDLLNEAANRRNIKLVVLAGDPSMYLPGAKDVDIRQCDTLDYEIVKKMIDELQPGVVGLLSPTDTWGVQAAKLCEEMGLPLLTGSARLEQLRDKQWVRKAVEGILNQPTEPVRANQSYILKPRRGTGSQNISLFSTLNELQEYTGQKRISPDEWVIEPYFLGPLFSAETYSSLGKMSLLGVTNRIMSPEPLFVEVVKSFPHLHGTAWEAVVESWVESVLRSIGLENGFAHIEFIETRNGLQLVEVNARMPGALIGPAIYQTTGIDIYDMLIADCLGETPRPIRRKVSCGHSHVSLYAENAGTLTSIDGIEQLSDLPGAVGWLPTKSIGDRVDHVGDYKSRVGNVYATAFDSALAQDYALAASRLIAVTVDSDS